MKLNSFCLALCLAAAFGAPQAQAAISVTAAGAGPITFEGPAAPPVGEWSTLTVGGNNAGAYTTDTVLDSAVVTTVAASVATVLGTSGTTTPAPSGNSIARLNTVNRNIQTRVTGNAYTLLKATLQNTTPQSIIEFTASYDFGALAAAGSPITEEIPGYRAFYSLSGAANSWVAIPAFTTGTPGTLSATITGISWPPGSSLYLLWADDNGSGTTTDSAGALVEGCYTIDNFSVSGVMLDATPVPISIVLDSPTNNAAAITPGVLTASATTFGTVPATAVAFFVNGVHLATDTTAPYSVTVTDPPAGIYSVQAFATNGVDPVAASAVSTLYIREANALINSLVYFQNFEGMVNAEETITPEGWYTGAGLPATNLRVAPDDGSLAPTAAILGNNYGSSGDFERSLGGAPTGGDREIVLHLRNGLSENITSFFVKYDGETWRTHNDAGIIEHLTNYVSFDNGATWIPTDANYTSPVPGVNPAVAVNGNDPANRVADITSLDIIPATPVSPGNVILIRWHNRNDGGTDGGMSIDNVQVEITGTSPYTLSVDITNPLTGASVEADCAGLATIPVTATASGVTTNVAFQVDGGPAVNDTTAPFSVSLAGVSLGNHTITATAKDSFGNTATDTINVSVIANQAPVVAFTNTYSGANTGLVFLVGSPITCQFSVSDANIANVEFLVNNLVIFATNTAYGTLTVGDALAGLGTLTVRATDTCGSVASASRNINVTNPPVTVIVTNGSAWKYFNSNTAPPNDGLGRQWFESNFDDAAWLSGFAEFGGGDTVLPPAAATVPERTLLDIGPAGNRHTTAYFRHTFNWASAQGGLVVSSMHDDGAVVYLNGTIVATFNMPIQGSYAYGDFALGAVAGDGSTYYSSNITALLVAGQNVLAVEVHQNDLTSSDIGFDLMLNAVVSAPSLTITSDGVNYTVTWNDPGNAYRLQQSTDIGNPANWADIVSDPASPYVQPIPAGSGHRFFRLRQRP